MVVMMTGSAMRVPPFGFPKPDVGDSRPHLTRVEQREPLPMIGLIRSIDDNDQCNPRPGSDSDDQTNHKASSGCHTSWRPRRAKIGPVIVSAAVEYGGWPAAMWPVILVLLMTILLAGLLKWQASPRADHSGALRLPLEARLLEVTRPH
jgi:hypothetical protein